MGQLGDVLLIVVDAGDKGIEKRLRMCRHAGIYLIGSLAEVQYAQGMFDIAYARHWSSDLP